MTTCERLQYLHLLLDNQLICFRQDSNFHSSTFRIPVRYRNHVIMIQCNQRTKTKVLTCFTILNSVTTVPGIQYYFLIKSAHAMRIRYSLNPCCGSELFDLDPTLNIYSSSKQFLKRFFMVFKR
jgi:hypothetical protein